jgi:hypothetical protein
MSLELVNTLATFGTFVVIAATAIAAVVQLRHARSSNQIAALDELRTVFQSSEFSQADNFLTSQVRDLVKNPAFRYQWVNLDKRTEEFQHAIRSINLVGNYFEDFGAILLAGLIDRELACTIYAGNVSNAWDRLSSLAAMLRRSRGKALRENFEYLALISKKWLEAHPDGAYPHGAPRLPLVDDWLEADKQYAASLAPA